MNKIDSVILINQKVLKLENIIDAMFYLEGIKNWEAGRSDISNFGEYIKDYVNQRWRWLVIQN